MIMNDTKRIFKKQPLCEVCGKQAAVSFSLIQKKWMFTCYCTAKTEGYYVTIDDYFSHPSENVDSLAHLHEKPWMDWNDFMSMMHRFRKQIGLWG